MYTPLFLAQLGTQGGNKHAKSSSSSFGHGGGYFLFNVLTNVSLHTLATSEVLYAEILTLPGGWFCFIALLTDLGLLTAIKGINTV